MSYLLLNNDHEEGRRGGRGEGRRGEQGRGGGEGEQGRGEGKERESRVKGVAGPFRGHPGRGMLSRCSGF